MVKILNIIILSLSVIELWHVSVLDSFLGFCLFSICNCTLYLLIGLYCWLLIEENMFLNLCRVLSVWSIMVKVVFLAMWWSLIHKHNITLLYHLINVLDPTLWHSLFMSHVRNAYQQKILNVLFWWWLVSFVSTCLICYVWSFFF
jgi:hypothetical protein